MPLVRAAAATVKVPYPHPKSTTSIVVSLKSSKLNTRGAHNLKSTPIDAYKPPRQESNGNEHDFTEKPLHRLGRKSGRAQERSHGASDQDRAHKRDEVKPIDRMVLNTRRQPR